MNNLQWGTAAAAANLLRGSVITAVLQPDVLWGSPAFTSLWLFSWFLRPGHPPELHHVSWFLCSGYPPECWLAFWFLSSGCLPEAFECVYPLPLGHRPSSCRPHGLIWWVILKRTDVCLWPWRGFVFVNSSEEEEDWIIALCHLLVAQHHVSVVTQHTEYLWDN